MKKVLIMPIVFSTFVFLGCSKNNEINLQKNSYSNVQIDDKSDEDQVIIKEYSYTASEDDSKNSAREKAIQQIKILINEEIGTHIESSLQVQTLNNNGLITKNIEKIIKTFSVGTSKVKILEDQWNGVTYYVRASVTINVTNTLNQLKEALKSPTKDKEEFINQLSEIDKLIVLGMLDYSQKTPNYESAFSNLQKVLSLDNKNKIANSMLGQFYYFGFGTKKDLQKAFEYFLVASEENESFAQCNLAKLYYFGEGVAKNFEKAFFWFKKSAENNFSDGQYHVGLLYHNGEGVQQDYKQAKYWYEKAILNGKNINAMVRLGGMHIFGEGIPQNFPEGLKLLEYASEHGNEFARTMMDKFHPTINHYYMGRANEAMVNNNAVEFFKYISKAANNDEIAAQYVLGNLYSSQAHIFASGDGTVKDDVKAAYWYTKAANSGNVSAQSALAGLYEKGLGVLKNPREAFYWYEKAANNGNILSQLQIGMMYLQGNGTLTNFKEAIKWFERVESSNKLELKAIAQSMLGLIYYNGMGVDVDKKKAATYYQDSFKNGYTRAKETWDSLKLWQYL